MPTWESDPHIPEKAYLVIGNGFDIEAGWPTKYTDFLQFLRLVDAKLNSSENEREIQCDDNIRELLNKKPPDESWRELLEYNYWYQHFLELNIRSNWIDFETEIGRVIRIIEYNMDHSAQHQLTMEDNVFGFTADIETALGDLLSPYDEKFNGPGNDWQQRVEYNVSFRSLRDRLKKDLDAFICGFEKYLRDYVEQIKLPTVGCIPNLLRLFLRAKNKYVICFNYTTAIERVLKAANISADVCYIHGKIGAEKNQMVLGMDEYLSDEQIPDHIGFASFRKYNQRIIKGTDNRYMDWLEQSKSGDCITYIFGHSLGIADREIIEPLVKTNGMRIAIYCYDEDHLDLAVTNLSAILGKKEMIRLTGGMRHRIEFRDQNDLRDKK